MNLRNDRFYYLTNLKNLTILLCKRLSLKNIFYVTRLIDENQKNTFKKLYERRKISK